MADTGPYFTGPYCWTRSSQMYFTEIRTATIVTRVLVIARTLENCSSPKVPVWAVMSCSSRTSIDTAFVQTRKMLQMASCIWVPAGMPHGSYTWSILKTENNLFKRKDIYEQRPCPGRKGEKWPKCLPRGILYIATNISYFDDCKDLKEVQSWHVFLSLSEIKSHKVKCFLREKPIGGSFAF